MGAGPDDPRYGLYGAAAQELIMGGATAITLNDPSVAVLSEFEQSFKAPRPRSSPDVRLQRNLGFGELAGQLGV